MGNNFVEELAERVKAIEESVVNIAKKYDDDLTATKARLTREAEQQLIIDRSKLLLSMAEVLDELERAARHKDSDGDSHGEGVELIIGMFRSRLEALGAKRVKVAGKPFDPETAQAVGTIPGEAGVVMDEILSGYMLDGKLIRAARVLVGDGREVAAMGKS